jgi:hypothetical protein
MRENEVLVRNRAGQRCELPGTSCKVFGVVSPADGGTEARTLIREFSKEAALPRRRLRHAVYWR